MSVQSKKRAKVIGTGNLPPLAFAALVVGLLALWPFSPASASTTAPYVGDMVRQDQDRVATAPEVRSLAGFRIHKTLRIFRPAATYAARPALRPAAGSVRIVLTPRRLAANTAPGQLGINPSEDVPVARDLMVRTTWAEAVEPTAQDNPFTLVGNRGGLVNATQTEVRGGEVWLTADAGRRETARPGVNATAAP